MKKEKMIIGGLLVLLKVCISIFVVSLQIAFNEVEKAGVKNILNDVWEGTGE